MKTNLKLISRKDEILLFEGKENWVMNEMVIINKEYYGFFFKYEDGISYISMIDDISMISEIELERTKKPFYISFSESNLGKIIDVIGREINIEQIDEKTQIKKDATKLSLFKEPQGIRNREIVERPLNTGMSIVDLITPIGFGQKQLIVGEKWTGKTSMALNIFFAQKDNKKAVYIYVAIDKKVEDILEIYETFKAKNILDKTIIVFAKPNSYGANKWLAPYAGAAIAEHFQEKHYKDSIIVYDDLSKQAWGYREVSLMADNKYAREKYPSDIFYSHSQLLERSGAFVDEAGKSWGSITAIPIVQTDVDDLFTYIATNVISITDGQIFTNKNLFNKSIIPAIDIGLSVSRIGSQVQSKLMKKFSSGLKGGMTESDSTLSEFTTISKDKLLEFNNRNAFKKIMIQKEFEIRSEIEDVIYTYLYNNNFLALANEENILDNLVKNIRSFLYENYLGKIMFAYYKVGKLTNQVLLIYLKNVILPFIKYKLLEKTPQISQHNLFIELFKDISEKSYTLLSDNPINISDSLNKFGINISKYVSKAELTQAMDVKKLKSKASKTNQEKKKKNKKKKLTKIADSKKVNFKVKTKPKKGGSNGKKR